MCSKCGVSHALLLMGCSCAGVLLHHHFKEARHLWVQLDCGEGRGGGHSGGERNKRGSEAGAAPSAPSSTSNSST